MQANPSRFQGCGGTCPVESVSWFDAVQFANRLSTREGLKPAYRVSSKGGVRWNRRADGYRLLTEAEWEYAARGGQPFPVAGGEPADVAWTSENAGGSTHPGCTQAPNGLGLCDMSGNVREWVWDWYDADAYVSVPAEQTTGPEAGLLRVVRGGGWDLDASHARVARRDGRAPGDVSDGVGLRLGRSRQ